MVSDLCIRTGSNLIFDFKKKTNSLLLLELNYSEKWNGRKT